VSPDELYCLRSLKSKNYFLMTANGFPNYRLLFLWITSKIKILLASMKSFTNCENPSSKPLRGACSSFPLTACDFKSYSKRRMCFRKLSRNLAMNLQYTREINQWERRKADTEIWCGFRNILKISNCVQRSKQKLCVYFLLNKAGKNVKNVKNHMRMYRKYLIVYFIGLQQIFTLWT
jgi:hypothetical protein